MKEQDLVVFDHWFRHARKTAASKFRGYQFSKK